MHTLRTEWALIAAFALFFLACGFVVLSTAWQADLAVRWLFIPSLVVAYLLQVLWRNLDANHREEDQVLLNDLGWGNRLTLLRGLLVAGMMGFLMLPRPEGWLIWIPGVLYTLSISADFLDGYIARLTHRATRLGRILDLSFDGLGVLAASVLVVKYGQAPGWYLLVGFARYLFMLGEWLRRRSGKPIYPLPPSVNRRFFAGLQMGFLAVALWSLIPPPGIHIAATLFALPLLVGFGRDWLFICGLLKSRQKHNSKFHSRVVLWLPVGLRVIVLGLNLNGFYRWLAASYTEAPLFGIIWLSYWLAAGMIILGILPRLASIMALLGLGLAQFLAPLTPTQIALGVACILILYIGSGLFSLWTPEDHLTRRHLGGKSAATIGQEP